MGVWIDSGSRDEPLALNGISHFVEHMVFKGTTSRSAQQFAREVDSIGGNLDAFTGKESICFNIKVLDENVAPALDLLSDLVLHPTFTPEDIAREQGVILEEIKMDEDNPDYLVHETFTQNFWKGDALGRPILGTTKTVASFTQQLVFDFYAGRFTRATWSSPPPATSTTTASSRRSPSTSARSPHPASRPRKHPAPAGHASAHHAQAQEIPRAGPALPRRARAAGASPHPLRRLSPQLMLGGGMSSRLFQTIREDRGLAYSIYSETSPFRDTGALSIYAGTSAEKAPEVLSSPWPRYSVSKRTPYRRQS
jgi:predicted Zn-dependent peptidase